MMVSVSSRVRTMAGAMVFGAIALAAGASGAQQVTTPQLTPVPSVQPEPAPSALAAARDVVEASGMARSFEPMVPELAKQIVPTITRTRPELAKDLTDVVNQLGPEFQKDGDKMIDIAAHIYARKMSEDELKQTAAFFKTPAGARYVSVQPEMLDELVVAMQSWTQEMSNIMMTRVRDEMKKKGHDLM